MLVSLLKRAFYDPYRAAKADPRISIDEKAILLKSARFDFRDTGGRVRVGAESMVGCNFIFESDAGEISIGERTFIGGGASLISRQSVTVGNDVTIGWGVYLYDHNSHSLDWRERAKDIVRQNKAYRIGRNIEYGKDWSTVKTAPVVVRDKAWIGFEAVILKGVTIGEGAVVAARSVVIEDAPAWTVVAGNPARVVKKIQPEEQLHANV